MIARLSLKPSAAMLFHHGYAYRCLGAANEKRFDAPGQLWSHWRHTARAAHDGRRTVRHGCCNKTEIVEEEEEEEEEDINITKFVLCFACVPHAYLMQYVVFF